MKTTATVFIFFFSMLNFLNGQHIDDYLADVYDQEWILKNEIQQMRISSFSESRKVEIKNMIFDFYFINGIKVLDTSIVERDNQKHEFKTCTNPQLPITCTKYRLDNVGKLLFIEDTNLIKHYYLYNEDGFLNFVVTKNLLLSKNKNLKNSPLIKHTSIKKYIRDDNNVLLQKVEFELNDSISISEKNLEEVIRGNSPIIRSIWQYIYDEHNNLTMVTIDKASRDQPIKRFRTIKVEVISKLPIKLTWYAGDMKDKNIRFTRSFSYKFYGE